MSQQSQGQIMAKPMFLRKLKNRIFFAMATVIAGKPKGNYMAFVGKASCARLCDRIVELGPVSYTHLTLPTRNCV